MALTVDKTAGPFLVTSQATGGTVAGGSSVPVTWDVKGTDRLAKSVKISLSTDGGTTFGTVLAASTPNDGSETMVMPNVDAAKVRIKVEAVDNYFFAVNAADFALKAAPGPETSDHVRTHERVDRAGAEQKFTYASSVTPATFRCTVDEEMLPLRRLRRDQAASGPGTHTFGVAAVNAAGVADATPATVSSRCLATRAPSRGRAHGTEEGQAGHVRRLRHLAAQGLRARHPVPATERIVLVIGEVKNGGAARVFLGKRKLGKS